MRAQTYNMRRGGRDPCGGLVSGSMFQSQLACCHTCASLRTFAGDGAETWACPLPASSKGMRSYPPVDRGRQAVSSVGHRGLRCHILLQLQGWASYGTAAAMPQLERPHIAYIASRVTEEPSSESNPRGRDFIRYSHQQAPIASTCFVRFNLIRARPHEEVSPCLLLQLDSYGRRQTLAWRQSLDPEGRVPGGETRLSVTQTAA